MFNDVESLEQQVRDITDELNTKDITQELIHRMLTRAQQDLVRLLMRRYKQTYMQEVTVAADQFEPSENGSPARSVNLPMLNFGGAISDVAVTTGGSWMRVMPLAMSANVPNDYVSAGSIPQSYSTMGAKMFVYPGLGVGNKLRIRFQFRPLPFTPTLGRIVEFDKELGTMTIVDQRAGSLSTDVNSLAGFVNIVDPITGVIKATVQLSGIDEETGELQIKSAPLGRERVFGLAVATELPSTVTVDDVICAASGSCIPYLATDLTNYLVEMAAFMVKRAMGAIANDDYSERDRIVADIGKMWSGRENATMITKHRSAPWNPMMLLRGPN